MREREDGGWKRDGTIDSVIFRKSRAFVDDSSSLSLFPIRKANNRVKKKKKKKRTRRKKENGMSKKFEQTCCSMPLKGREGRRGRGLNRFLGMYPRRYWSGREGGGEERGWRRVAKRKASGGLKDRHAPSSENSFEYFSQNKKR